MRECKVITTFSGALHVRLKLLPELQPVTYTPNRKKISAETPPNQYGVCLRSSLILSNERLLEVCCSFSEEKVFRSYLQADVRVADFKHDQSSLPLTQEFLLPSYKANIRKRFLLMQTGTLDLPEQRAGLTPVSGKPQSAHSGTNGAHPWRDIYYPIPGAKICSLMGHILPNPTG